MLALTLDTSTAAVVAGVVRLDLPDRAPKSLDAVSERITVAARGHGELLSGLIEECLREAGIGPGGVDVVIAGVGPGPFTGLRVGLVTAAAFADAIGVPAYPVCSLDAVALRAPRGMELAVLSDARRREVYWARYDARGVRVAGPDVARPAELDLAGATHLAGDGADLYGDLWSGLERLPLRHPDPLGLAGRAADAIAAGPTGEALTPLYLRRPDAVVPGAPKAVTR